MFYPKIQLLIDQGRFPDAEAAIRNELKDLMDDEFLFYLLSIVLLKQDKPKEAEKAVREAIRLEPEFDSGFFMLSRILLAQEKKKEALEAVNEAIRIDPDDADNHSQKAQVYLDWSKYELSLKSAEEGLAMDPDHDGCRFFRSITLEKLGRKEEADAESLAMLADDPDDFENHTVRGWVLAQRGDTEGAERHFVEALRINPDSADAKNGLAFAFKLKRPFLGAILRSLIWMERIPMWWAIIGVFLIMRFGDKLASSELPTPLPQLGNGLRLLIWTFFVLILLIHPLFNVVLSRSKTSRHALTEGEITAVKWSYFPLILAGAFLVWWIANGSGRHAPIHVICWASVVKLVYDAFQADNLWVRRCMFGVLALGIGIALWVEYYSWVILFPKMLAIVIELKEAALAENKEAIESLGKQMIETTRNSLKFAFYPSMALWFLSSFGDDIREFFIRRAPD